MSPSSASKRVESPPPVVVAETSIPAGRRARVELPVARLPTGTWLNLPMEVVNGARSGPSLWLSGAIHGDEVLGVEIIREVLSQIKPRTLVGRVFAVPIVNVFGFIQETRYLPDRRDLNRSFPGSSRGSLAGRIAHLFMTEVVEQCEVGLDLHCGSDDRTNLPQIRGDLEDPETRRIAEAFAAPVMIHSVGPTGSLRKAAQKKGVRTLVYEAGEARRFDPDGLTAGVAGVIGVMTELGMIEPEPQGGPSPSRPPSSVSRNTGWVRAGRAGILKLDTTLGAPVRKGERLGVVRDAFGMQGLPVRANRTGMVIGLTVNPVVFRGEAVAHIAQLEEE